MGVDSSGGAEYPNGNVHLRVFCLLLTVFQIAVRTLLIMPCTLHHLRNSERLLLHRRQLDCSARNNETGPRGWRAVLGCAFLCARGLLLWNTSLLGAAGFPQTTVSISILRMTSTSASCLLVKRSFRDADIFVERILYET